jgi:hypothetical protein
MEKDSEFETKALAEYLCGFVEKIKRCLEHRQGNISFFAANVFY